MFEKTIHIDLTLPRSWNQCDTEQLETIAACIMKRTAMADRYHPFDWMDVKSELFFLLTGTEIIRIETNEEDPEDVKYLCRNAGGKNRRAQEFNLRPWQVLYWIDSQLKWLDDENNYLLFFPYKQLVYTRHWQWKWPFTRKVYHAPAELLQDFTWQQYRHLQDYMSMFIDQQNALVKAGRRRQAPEVIEKMQAEILATRNEFLRILFTPHTQTGETDGPSIQKSVKRISEVQWQVILLWWSGMMHYLKEHYPRCFRSAPTKRKSKNPPNPFDLYTSIITTIQDKAHIEEDKINNQTYTIVLEHLERIARENEEIEKMNKKHRPK